MDLVFLVVASMVVTLTIMLVIRMRVSLTKRRSPDVARQVTEARKLMRALVDIDVRYCLTGSIYFGGWIAGKSDIDLIVEASGACTELLRSKGFEYIPGNYNCYHGDPLISGRFRKRIGKLSIDVQLTRKFDRKKEARDNLHRSKEYLQTAKRNRAALWYEEYAKQSSL